jgi:hypothetical protein
MLQAILTRFFPRSLQLAHQRWHQAISAWQAGQQELAREITATNLAAQEAGVDAPEEVGLLRVAQEVADMPVPRRLLAVHNNIRHAFAMLGTSRWRPAPDRLAELIEDYEKLVAAESQSRQELIRRLQLIRNTLADLRQHPEYAEGLSPRHVLEYPEYAEALLALGQVRWRDRQVCLASMQRSFLRRLELGQSWLHLLRENMSAYQHRLGKRSLDTLQTQAPPTDAPDLQAWLDLHTKLNKPLLRLNRLSVESLRDG